MTANRAAFDRAIANWNAGDLDAYLELYGESILLHGYSEEPMTKPEVAGMYRGLHEALEGIHIEVHDVIEEDDRLSARATMSGTHRGELFGVPGTGVDIVQPVITHLRFVDGRCVERWSVADTLAVLLQIGAVTLPG
ncbi:MAG: ester cyclase [Acidimicrobiales bacterium]|nr:ester cyclase [Acidimicrobiales bacterium]